MHYADANSIVVAPGRMREEFNEEAHLELMRSIMSPKGLLHPPVCRTQEGQVVLVAGERRLRAMRAILKAQPEFRIWCGGEQAPKGTIPFQYIHELPEEEIIEAELEENVCRKDLSWQERSAGRATLLKLRQAKAAAAGKKYGADELSRDLDAAGASDASARQIRDDLTLARYLDNPQVQKAKTIGEAQKIIKKEKESFFLAALGETLSEAPPPKHELLIGDCLDLVANLPSNTFDCICTDPPYGISIDDSGSMVTHEHHYDDSPEYFEEILERLPFHLYRITREQAHLYWFCDLRNFPKICHALEEAGFLTWFRPIIWGKRGKTMATDITRWPRSSCEFIVYAIKGDRPPLKVADDLIVTTYGSDLQQAEKPKELYVELLSRSVLAGQKVIDLFCGTGVIFQAADELKCSATGIEKDANRAELAKMRAYEL
jgi:DNA modification methylase/ParB-like chromosome segregation protein Spo0J